MRNTKKTDDAIIEALSGGPMTYQQLAAQIEVAEPYSLAIRIGRLVMRRLIKVQLPVIWKRHWPVYYIGQLPKRFKMPYRPNVDSRVME